MFDIIDTKSGKFVSRSNKSNLPECSRNTKYTKETLIVLKQPSLGLVFRVSIGKWLIFS